MSYQLVLNLKRTFAYEAVFRDPDIVSIILDYATGFKQQGRKRTAILGNLKLRLINKAFNEACLIVIRKYFQCIDVNAGHGEPISQMKRRALSINWYHLTHSEAMNLFDFLRFTVKLNVKSVHFWDEWKDREMHQKFMDMIVIHNDERVDLLTSIYKFCPGVPGKEGMCLMCQVAFTEIANFTRFWNLHIFHNHALIQK